MALFTFGIYLYMHVMIPLQLHASDLCINMTGAKVNHVDTDPSDGHIMINFNGSDETCPYPAVFLRNNCQCDHCFDHIAKGNKILMQDVDPEVKAKHVKTKRPETVIIEWDDGHVSEFNSLWLWKRRFSDEGRKERSQWYKRKPKLWGSEVAHNIPTDTFNNILHDEHALYRWILTLEEIGLFLITDAPPEVGQLEKLGNRVAFLRQNNYGSTFQVKSKKNPSNLAYTSHAIGMHTDLPYYYYVPGMQMLHCIEQTDMEGGENGFADGFWAANQLKSKYPDYFKLLTTLPIDYWDIGEDFYQFYLLDQKPMIRLNDKGDVIQITHNPQTRDSFSSIPADEIKPLIRAMKTFDDLLYSEDNIVRIKMNPGNIACFHNYRVLHSRTSFKATGNIERHLEGGFMDWDELTSRRRLLSLQYNFMD